MTTEIPRVHDCPSCGTKVCTITDPLTKKVMTYETGWKIAIQHTPANCAQVLLVFSAQAERNRELGEFWCKVRTPLISILISLAILAAMRWL